jgi:hypothetical protein
MYYAILLMVAFSTLKQAKLNPSDILCWKQQACALRLMKARNNLLKIDWKPISVFPEEARRRGIAVSAPRAADRRH